MQSPTHGPRAFDPCLLSEIPAVATPRDLWESYRRVSVPYPDTEFGRQLQAYQIPPGLDEPGFLAAVRSAFFASRLLARLTDELRTRDLYFGELKRWLLATCADSGGLSARDLTGATGVLLNWMEGLGPPRYKVDRPHHSERVRYRTGVPSEVLLRAPGIRSNRALPEEG
jgi:hypothetical protein